LGTNLFLDGVLPGEQLLAPVRSGRVGGIPDLLLLCDGQGVGGAGLGGRGRQEWATAAQQP